MTWRPTANRGRRAGDGSNPARHATGEPNCVVEVDHPSGGLVLLPARKCRL